MQPMSAAIDNVYAGLGEAGADGAEELLGDERVSAAANYEHRARERTDGGCILRSVVPDVDVAGDDVR